MHELQRIHEEVERLIAAGQAGLLVTVIGTSGSTYRRPGARSVIGVDGSIAGAISGGCVERDIALRAKSWLADFAPRVITYDSSSADDIVFGLGLGCRGRIEMLVQPFDAAHRPELPPIPEKEAVRWTTMFEGRIALQETIEPQRAIAIFGRGPDTEPVAALARAIGWRAEIIRSHDSPDLDGFHAAVIMTHNFLHDVALVEAAFASGVAYIGLLGPKSRGEEILTQIGSVTPDMVSRLHNPIGLDLGGDSPEAIALSIVSEIQSKFHDASAQPLRDKAGPIHESRVKTVAVVLAAGGSSRLGRPKQLLDYRGEALVVHAARVALGAQCDRTVVIWSAPGVPPLLACLPVELIENREWEEGIASSIRKAVEAAGQAKILLTLADQPLVTSEHLRKLIESSAAIAATGYNAIAGVPAAFAPELRDDLLALRGDHGARSIIEKQGAEIIPFEAAAVDIDREEDYRRL